MKACTFRNLLLFEMNRKQNIQKYYMLLPCSVKFQLADCIRRGRFVYTYVRKVHPFNLYILLLLLLIVVVMVVVVVVLVVVVAVVL